VGSGDALGEGLLVVAAGVDAAGDEADVEGEPDGAVDVGVGEGDGVPHDAAARASSAAVAATAAGRDCHPVLTPSTLRRRGRRVAAAGARMPPNLPA
jgi:hypothetical protein